MVVVDPFSPHAWGWSAVAIALDVARKVFPTRVGMVRYYRMANLSRRSFPHTRGDGPLRSSCCARYIWFSPHAWGWSVCSYFLCRLLSVFPTRVGMVRSDRVAKSVALRFPHTRGDGPRTINKFILVIVFSPHAWGWSAIRAKLLALSGVFPTRVGMVRRDNKSRDRRRCFPHTRGDGPETIHSETLAAQFSPHAWGWSVVNLPFQPQRVSFPHTRGDGPQTLSIRLRLGSFSPHAWGWSVGAPELGCTIIVFPTRVGMVRFSGQFRFGDSRFPHTRGDGPLSDAVKVIEDEVFPTRVGMVRMVSRFPGAWHSFPHTRGDGPTMNI